MHPITSYHDTPDKQGNAEREEQVDPARAAEPEGYHGPNDEHRHRDENADVHVNLIDRVVRET